MVKTTIEELLRSTKRAGIEALIDAMDEMGFYSAPCSGSFHLARSGGLAEHSLNVYRYAMKVRDGLGVKIDDDTLIIASLLHDLGKVGNGHKPNYVPNYLKSGKQSDSKPYETNKDLLYEPHEVRSIVLASKYIELTEEEEHAIYYHNGKYTHTGYDLKETPLQMIIHFADLWCAKEIEV